MEKGIKPVGRSQDYNMQKACVIIGQVEDVTDVEPPVGVPNLAGLSISLCKHKDIINSSPVKHG